MRQPAKPANFGMPHGADLDSLRTMHLELGCRFLREAIELAGMMAAENTAEYYRPKGVS